MIDLDDFTATPEELREHACGCEYCSQTSVPCTATKSSIMMARLGDGAVAQSCEQDAGKQRVA